MSTMSVAIAVVSATSGKRVSAVIFWSRVCAASVRMRPIAATEPCSRVLALTRIAGSVVYCFCTAPATLSRSASVRDSETNETLRGARIAPFAAVENLAGEDHAAAVSGEVDLRDVSCHDGLRTEAKPSEEHLHLLRRGVLRLVEDDERLVKGPATHERQWRDLDLAALLRAG